MLMGVAYEGVHSSMSTIFDSTERISRDLNSWLSTAHDESQSGATHILISWQALEARKLRVEYEIFTEVLFEAIGALVLSRSPSHRFQTVHEAQLMMTVPTTTLSRQKVKYLTKRVFIHDIRDVLVGPTTTQPLLAVGTPI